MFTVISVPVSLLWNVQIPLRKKLALGGIFSLSVFVMVASIVRAVVTSTPSFGVDMSWLYLWTSVEMSVGRSPPLLSTSVHLAHYCIGLWSLVEKDPMVSLLMTLHSSHSRLSCFLPRYFHFPDHLSTPPHSPRRAAQRPGTPTSSPAWFPHPWQHFRQHFSSRL